MSKLWQKSKISKSITKQCKFDNESWNSRIEENKWRETVERTKIRIIYFSLEE